MVSGRWVGWSVVLIKPHFTTWSQENNFDIFFSCYFTIVTADVITYYIVCLSFPGAQAKFS